MADNGCCSASSEQCCLKNIFLKACEENDLEKVKACLKLGVDPNIKSSDGREDFGLNYASWKNLPDLCDILLSQPTIDVNNKDEFGWTALMDSCYHGHSKITEKLVKVPGIELNSQNDFGCTAAIYAAWNNSFRCLNVLAKLEDVDWNIKNKNGHTVAHCAAVFCNRETVKMLMDIRKIDWNIKCPSGNSALSEALKINESDNVKMLLGRYIHTQVYWFQPCD